MMACVDSAELQKKAEKFLPRLFRDYVAGGAHEERTLQANRDEFRKWTIKPRCLRDVSSVSTTTQWLGYDCSAPFMLAPVGFAGMMRQGGDLMAVRAAAKEKIPFCVSTFSIASLEEICQVPGADVLAQIYVFRDRDITRDMMERARKCGVRTLIFTVDTPVTPLRPRDERNGFRRLSKPSLAQLASFAAAWRWGAGMARHGMPQLRNLSAYGMGHSLLEQAKNAASQIDPGLTWRDLEWFRAQWNGQLLVKGIMHADDAARCVAAGADAVIVSNHGGRQLDPAPATLAVLPEIVQSAGQHCSVVIDSGIRRGGDVVTSLAQGASLTASGRPWAWAVAAGGETGVREMISLLRREIYDVLALSGHNSVESLRLAGVDVLKRQK
ncbi:alpha-hydroxy acid oxidase [Acetobacter thailandicus]|uniref:alpha-hydroxy acid oxidase n=1 Tax=Acetobacter thailandicus TaxID=1502842 RepID=UPI002012ACF8|nr:alpha-hydroxy acid oxidase [Acetobacter thailandicus]